MKLETETKKKQIRKPRKVDHLKKDKENKDS